MACEVRACRACLATDARLLSLEEASLQHHYCALTGEQPHALDGLPQQLCYECAARARRCGEFRERCLRGRDALRHLLRAHRWITEDGVRAVDRRGAGLLSPLAVAASPPPLLRQEDETAPNCDVDIKDEWDADEHCGNSPAPTIKSDNELTINHNDIKNDHGDDDVSHNVLNSDLNEVKSDDDEPLANRLATARVPRAKTDGVKKRHKSKKLKHKPVKHKKKKAKVQEGEIVDEVTKKTRGRKKFDEDFADVIILTHEEQMEELQKRQNSLNYTNSPYKCDKCYKGFVDAGAYGNHMQRHDPGSGEFVCAVCEVRSTTRRKLKSHVVAAHGRKYSCRTCDHVSNTSNQAREHEKWHKGFTYECKLCGEIFRKSTTHLTHMRLRHPTEFVCEMCGDAFVGRHGLAVHKKRTHKDAEAEIESGAASESVYCAKCDVHFSTEEAWKRHTVTSAKHSTNNDFGNGCRICGEVLPSKAELTVHSWTHVRRAPDGQPADVACDRCDAMFTSSRKCLAHYKRMHLGMKYPVKKNVVCEVCGKKCTSNATLAYHQRTHTGEKPFQCSECPKRFSIRQRLQIHERTHTGERPYPCRLCHKAFRHKPALNRHSRVHTGAKPYECNHCGKTFSQSNSMKLHVHTVHLKLPPPYRSKGGPKVALTAVALPAQRL